MIKGLCTSIWTILRIDLECFSVLDKRKQVLTREDDRATREGLLVTVM